MSVGQVGNSWGFFTTAGGANYGFYDDEWPLVRADGKHSQLIEINTKGGPAPENDRYAGIYQYITGLQPGVTYEFTMKGLLRGTGNEDDPFRFAAQWGYNKGYNGDWKAVSDWTQMNLGPISKRTEPGPVATWTMKFVASSHDMTLFIRGWKKWAIANVEMDFNIDAVSVRACGPTGGPVHPIYPPDCATRVARCSPSSRRSTTRRQTARTRVARCSPSSRRSTIRRQTARTRVARCSPSSRRSTIRRQTAAVRVVRCNPSSHRSTIQMAAAAVRVVRHIRVTHASTWCSRGIRWLGWRRGWEYPSTPSST